MKHRTGLHNRWRSGRGSYSVKRKSREADHYGRAESGWISDNIAGRLLRYKVGTEKLEKS